MNIVLIVATFRRTLASLRTLHRTQFIYEMIRKRSGALSGFATQKLDDSREIEASGSLAGEQPV